MNRYVLIIVLLFSASTLFAQGLAEINGKVTGTDETTGIPGVSVVIKGTSTGTTTDTEGNFTLSASKGSVIVFSFIGYESQEITLSNQTYIKIQLRESISNLNEIVVVGYGEMKRTDMSSSQVTVTGKDLQRTINTSLEQGLQGRAANVVVTQSSGQPGAAPTVMIRGLSSLTGSTQPLYVIDGVQIKPDNVKDDPNNRPTGFSNILSSLNPDDIETINVLQGPSATAIFGAVGANGVIMITTKRGKAGETKISYNALFTLQDEPKHIDVMNLQQYAQFRNELEAAGSTATDPMFADPSVLGPGTNWQAELYRPTLLQKHSLSLSGGSQTSGFYFSGEYFNQEGIAPGSGFERYAARINLDNQTRKWLKIGTNLNVGLTKEKVNTNNGGIIQLALQQNPGVPVRNPDGSWGGPSTTQFQYTNPIMIANIYNDYNRRMSLIGGTFADMTFLKNFTLHNEINGSLENYRYYSYHPGYTAGGFVVSQESAVSRRMTSTNYWWSFNSRLQYDKSFGKHNISAMAGHEAQSWGYESLDGLRRNFVTNSVEELSGGDGSNISNVSNNSSRNAGAKESYFARANYIYNDKYIVQATYRADGYSGFGPNNKWGYFPAVSVAWKLSEEAFLKQINAVNTFKLRLEYGESGNSGNSSTAIYSPLQTVPTPWGTGFLSQNFPNPDLKWETTRTINAGIDLNMFDNRLEIIADAYLKNIRDLITTNTFPYTLGGDIAYSPGYIGWPVVNAGSMKNKGLGITINTVNIAKNDFTWKTGLNFSIDRNRITQLANPMNPSWNSSQVVFLTKAGQPASMITGYVAEGLFQNQNDILNHAVQTSNGVMTVSPNGSWAGDIKFKDINGDNLIDAQDRVVIGNPWPKMTLGFNTGFNYKNWDLNIFAIGSVGNDIVNWPRYTMEIPGNTGTFGNYFSSVTNYARPSSYNVADAESVVLTNPGFQVPRIAPGDPNGNNRMNNWFIEDGSYLRIKNVSLGYNVPKKVTSKIGIVNLRGSVGVQNLLTFTKYKGYDPEVGMVNYGGTIMAGVDTGRYPSVRMYSFNLIADF